MKKLNLYLLLTMLLITLPVVQSCDDDGNSLGTVVGRMATVRSLGGDAFYLEADNGEKLWIGAPVDIFYYYRPVDGQRSIIYYTPLGGKNGEYDQTILLRSMKYVRTKTVEDLTAENEDVFGDDKMNIRDVWVGGNYLNVQFYFNLPRNTPHRVSLVKNTTVEPEEDGYVHLEYRYNDEDDVTNYRAVGMVSFNLGDYAPSLAAGTYKGLKIRFNTIDEGVKILTYDFNKADNTREVIDSEEIKEQEEGKYN